MQLNFSSPFLRQNLHRSIVVKDNYWIVKDVRYSCKRRTRGVEAPKLSFLPLSRFPLSPFTTLTWNPAWNTLTTSEPSAFVSYIGYDIMRMSGFLKISGLVREIPELKIGNSSQGILMVFYISFQKTEINSLELKITWSVH